MILKLLEEMKNCILSKMEIIKTIKMENILK